MDLPTTTDQSNPHLRLVMVDSAEWRARLERFAEMGAHPDEDAALDPAFVLPRSP
jgi:hypothetical protein